MDTLFNTYSKWISKHSLIYKTMEYNYSNNIQTNIAHDSILPKMNGDSSSIKWVSRYSTNVSVLKSISRVVITPKP